MAPARFAVVALAAALAAVGVAPTAATASPEGEMLAGLNGVRAQVGARPLAPSSRLTRDSNAHAHRMLRRNQFGHSAPRRGLGEILAIHSGDVGVGQVIHAWLQSGGHRGLMLEPSFRRVGVAREVGQIGGRRTTVWVVRMRRG